MFKDWKTIKRKINKLTSQFSFLEKSIHYPDEWLMNEWVSGTKPEELILTIRDPVEIISYILIDPILQFHFSQDLYYNFIELRNCNNDRVIRVIMTTE